MDLDIFKKISYGMYIVSTSFNNKNFGCIVNSVVQITSSNPIISISINKNNYTNKIIKETKKLALSILSNNTSKDIISKFGFYTSETTDKFLDVNYEMIENIPVVNEDICGYLIGNVIDIIDCETHDIFLVRVEITKVLNDLIPMTYEYYQTNLKGSSPKNAPTYIEKKIDGNGKKYKCIICGHIYDDSIEKIKFEDLPDDWKCPVCGVSKDKFELIN